MAKKSLDKGRRRERELAKVVGGKRTGIVGQAEKPDVENDEFVFELKSKAKLPGWMLKGIGQAQAAGFNRGKEGILVIEQCALGKEPIRIYCIIGDAAWLKHHGGEQKAPASGGETLGAAPDLLHQPIIRLCESCGDSTRGPTFMRYCPECFCGIDVGQFKERGV